MAKPSETNRNLPSSVAELREDVAAHIHSTRLRPRRQFGQHFLVDPIVRDSLIYESGVQAHDTVLEIGAGTGVVTEALSAAAGRVLACELDRRLAFSLKRCFRHTNVSVIEGDIFHQNLLTLGLKDRSYLLIASLPYNITGLVLRNFLMHNPRPRTLTLLIQKEVADRLTATKGKMSFLSVYAQTLAEVEMIFEVPPESFWPQPEVTSAIVVFTTRPAPPNDRDQAFLRIVKAGFSAPRKMLRNTLSGGLRKPASEVAAVLQKVGLVPTVRAHELSLPDWEGLVSILSPEHK